MQSHSDFKMSHQPNFSKTCRQWLTAQVVIIPRVGISGFRPLYTSFAWNRSCRRPLQFKWCIAGQAKEVILPSITVCGLFDLYAFHAIYLTSGIPLHARIFLVTRGTEEVIAPRVFACRFGYLYAAVVLNRASVAPAEVFWPRWEWTARSGGWKNVTSILVD